MTIYPEPRYSNGERRANRRYMREFIGALAVYAGLLVPSLAYGPGLEPGLGRTALLVAPALGFFLVLWAIARHILGLDDYQRRLTLETFSLAAAVTAGFAMTYGFLENAGFPRQSMFLVWGVMGGAWAAIGLYRCTIGRS